MMEVDISFANLIELFLVFLAVYLASKLLRIEIRTSRLALMAILSYFLVPAISGFLPFVILPYLTPLIAWLILGELLLTSTNPKNRALLAIIAYLIYACLILSGIHAALLTLMG